MNEVPCRYNQGDNMVKNNEQDTVSFARAVSVDFIRASGGYAVKCVKAGKNPAKGWDPRMNTEAKSEQTLAEIQYTDDNIGLHMHGNLVDVDVDGDDSTRYLIPALDKFLPPSSHIWGRKSKPRSHRAYSLKGENHYDPAEHKVLTRFKRIPQVKVEIRGGPVTRGEYTLMPGSIHDESKEPYEWDDVGRARSTPAVTELRTLIDAVRMAGAVTVLAPYWVEGMRQDLTMALAGFLHRSKALAESLSPEFFCLDRDEASRFIEVLLEIAGDDPSDRAARRKCFDATWAKAENGSPVTGATTIAELTGDPDLVKHLYTLLTDNPDVVAIDEFTQRFVIWQGPALAIDLDLAQRGAPKPFMTRQNFASSYGHKYIDVDDKRRLLPEMLWSLSSATRVCGVTFDPSAGRIAEDAHGEKVNLWSGFQIEPHIEEVSDAEVEPFINYVYEVICNRSNELYTWIMGWVADIFQEPANKPKTCLVLVGEQGAGKSILGHSILGPIIGDSHYVSTDAVENIIKDFNVAFANKILIQGDEATNSRQKSAAARMKSFITDPKQKVEPKGVDSYYVPNHSRVLLTSNDIEDAIYLNSGTDDRRYTIVEVSPDRKNDVDTYWVPLISWIEDPETLPKIHRWLKDFTYNKRILQRPIVTAAKKRMMQSSWDAFDGWLAAMVSRGYPLTEHRHEKPYYAFKKYNANVIDRTEWPEYANVTALLDDYRYYCRANNLRDAAHMTEAHIRQTWTRLGLITKETSKRLNVKDYDDKKGVNVTLRPRVYSVPSEKRILDYLQRKHGFEIGGDVEIETDEGSVSADLTTEF